MKKNRPHISASKFLYGCLLLLLCACNPTKYVPKNEYLLDDVSVSVDAKGIKTSDLEPYFKQKSNLRIFKVVRFHLGVYNFSGTNQKQWINRWLRDIGEAPVIYDKDKEDATLLNLKEYMRTKGYFDAEVSVLETQKKPQRLRVKYLIKANKPFRIHSYALKIDNPQVHDLIVKDSLRREIKVGALLDADKHDAERTRIINVLRTNGYYNFEKKDVGFLVDTSYTTHAALDTLIIDSTQVFGTRDQDRNKYQKYTIRYINIYTDYNNSKAIRTDSSYFKRLDSLSVGNIRFFYTKAMNIRTSTWLNRIYMVPNTLYNSDQAEKTRLMLSDLKIVRYVNMSFNEVDSSQLDCSIFVNQGKSQSYTVDLEGTNSSGNYGGAVGLSYAHTNLFGGGESFGTKLKFSREGQVGTGPGVQRVDADEVGISNQLMFPQFMLPFMSTKTKKQIKASTVFDLDYNFQKRPDFSRTILTASYGYKWKSSEVWSHKLNVVDLNYVNMHYMSPAFQSLIDSTYLYYSYRDHLISATNYSIIYNDQSIKKFKDSQYLRLGIESAGNTLMLLSKIAHSSPLDSSYQIGGIPFAQYIKLDAEYAFNQYIDAGNNMVYRVVAGLGIPYGNASVMPFERRYFVGGANSLRGWQVRSLGPGVYRANNVDYYNQTGDIRLEANAEYRFKMVGILEGAVFSDAGNIWTIRNYESQPGGQFKLNEFYKQIAWDFGVGLRFDLSFVVLRFDLGMKLYDPSLELRQRWRLPDLHYGQDFTLNFAIGYPF